ncbi:MAG: YabP/YqfC family sporulation protein [Clostridia bacterium]|nr:YabP/YqfC family sporulation protein [Clostridia bacterium]
MGKKIKFISKKENKIKLLDEAKSIVGESLIEMISDRELTLDGCKSILDFSDTYISLKINAGSLLIYGKNLKIEEFEEKTIRVKGKIKTVEFCLREKSNV